MTDSPPAGRGTTGRTQPALDPRAADGARTVRSAGYRERLRVPLWWWPPALGIAGLLAAEVHLGYPGPRSWLPYLVLLPLTASTLVLMGHTAVRLSGESLRVGRAELPVRSIGGVEVIPAAGKRRALGPELDPAALLMHRPWVGPLLRVAVTDPASPTPYWIFSARRPLRLAALLDAATRRAGDEGGEQADTGSDTTGRSPGTSRPV